MALSNLDKHLLSGTHVVNFFLEDLLLDNLHDYWYNSSGEPFIVPSEQPEDVDNKNGYVVYTVLHPMQTEIFMLEEEQALYTIFHKDANVVNATINLVKKYLGRWDDSARFMNNWMRTDDKIMSLPQEWIDEVHKIDFKSIRLISASGIQPATDEGGRNDATITLAIQYVHDDRFSSIA